METSTDGRRFHDRFRDEIFRSGDRFVQAQSMGETRGDRCRKCTTRAMRRFGLNARRAVEADLFTIIQQVERLIRKMPAFDEHGARAHLAHDARGLTHALFILDAQPGDAFGFRDVGRRDPRQRQQLFIERFERFVIDQIVTRS